MWSFDSYLVPTAPPQDFLYLSGKVSMHRIVCMLEKTAEGIGLIEAKSRRGSGELRARLLRQILPRLLLSSEKMQGSLVSWRYSSMVHAFIWPATQYCFPYSPCILLLTNEKFSCAIHQFKAELRKVKDNASLQLYWYTTNKITYLRSVILIRWSDICLHCERDSLQQVNYQDNVFIHLLI